MSDTVLDRLGALERRHDGPIPPDALRTALAGGDGRLRVLEKRHGAAAAERRLRHALAVLARRRRAGKPGLSATCAGIARLREAALRLR
jgi:hypothetical protein